MSQTETDFATSIAQEFFSVKGQLRISINGLARLTKLSKPTIHQWIFKNNGVVLDINRRLIRSNGRGLNVVASTIHIYEAVDFMVYYASDSTHAPKEVKQHLRKLINAYAKLGIETWAKDTFNLEVDTVDSKAAINELLGLYPGIQYLTDHQIYENEVYVSCTQYLVDIKGLDIKSPYYKWMIWRLGNAASANYKSLKSKDPEVRIVCNRFGQAVKLRTYLLSELPIVDMAYARILSLQEYKEQ